MNPAIDTGVTGNPVQVYESSREMKWGYEKGAFYGVLDRGAWSSGSISAASA